MQLRTDFDMDRFYPHANVVVVAALAFEVDIVPNDSGPLYLQVKMNNPGSLRLKVL